MMGADRPEKVAGGYAAHAPRLERRDEAADRRGDAGEDTRRRVASRQGELPAAREKGHQQSGRIRLQRKDDVGGGMDKAGAVKEHMPGFGVGSGSGSGTV